MSRLSTPGLVLLPLILATSVLRIGAQEAKTAFEVASVKRSQSPRSDWNQDVPPGRFVATNAPLVNLIQYAYAVPDYLLEQVPSWVRNERFDIVAKAEEEVPTAQIQRMLRALLEDRFRLITRRETRDRPINLLVLARDDGRLGSGLMRVSGPDDCKDGSSIRRGAPPAAATLGGCGSISAIAGFAGRHTGTVVLDGTALTGTFQFTMHYASDLSATGDTSLPSFVTALQEQLGLRLRPSRGPVQVLVIESIERPSED